MKKWYEIDKFLVDGPTQGVENNDRGGQGQTWVVQTGIYTSILSQLINKGS